LIFENVEIEPLTQFISEYKINIPTINNQVITDYITQQKAINSIKEWTICLVSNTDKEVWIYDNPEQKTNRHKVKAKNYEVEVNDETIQMTCSVRNQTERNPLYKITKNQIDDLKDRQVDLATQGLKSNVKIK